MIDILISEGRLFFIISICFFISLVTETPFVPTCFQTHKSTEGLHMFSFCEKIVYDESLFSQWEKDAISHK